MGGLEIAKGCQPDSAESIVWFRIESCRSRLDSRRRAPVELHVRYAETVTPIAREGVGMELFDNTFGGITGCFKEIPGQL